MKLFGKKKKPQLTQEDTLKTLDNLNKTLEDISKRSELLQAKSRNEIQMALQKKKQGDKNGALICLKRKKMYENEVSKLEGSRMNLEQQKFSIEGASMNKNIFTAMRQGNDVMKSVHQDINIDEVDKLKDDMEEQHDLLNELNDAISQPIGFLSTVDDDELLGELDELEALEYEEQMINVGGTGVAVPEKSNVVEDTGPPQRAEESKQPDELDELYADMQI